MQCTYSTARIYNNVHNIMSEEEGLYQYKGIRSLALEQYVDIYWDMPEGSSLKRRLTEILMCPVCLAVPERGERIRQCHEGHAMCQKCFDNLDICPVCRGHLWLWEENKMYRNLAVMQVRDALRDHNMI